MNNIAEQIKQIEDILRKTPHHKATNGFIGAMRAQIARLKDKEIEINNKRKGGGGGYAIKKQGDATIVLIGPPSAGKSTLLNILTNAESKVAPYAFTTVSVIPGMLKHKGAYIQILDIPGLIEGASIGKGRGREVLSVARAADLLLIMTDPKRIIFFKFLQNELHAAGIRINKNKPDINIEKTLSGGILIRTNYKQDFDQQTVKNIAFEFGIKNAIITLKEKVTIDELIDAFTARITYKKAIFVVNKSDTVYDKNGDYLYLSAKKNIGIENLKNAIWKELQLLTVYLVNKNDKPNTNNVLVMKIGNTLKDVALKIGSEFVKNVDSAKIWGNGAKFDGQEVPLSTKVQEGMFVRFI